MALLANALQHIYEKIIIKCTKDLYKPNKSVRVGSRLKTSMKTDKLFATFLWSVGAGVSSDDMEALALLILMCA